jgi:hypothetical protein
VSASVPDLSNEWDRDKLRHWMNNAKRLGRHDVYQIALRQLCRVEGRNIDDPLESDFAIVMRARPGPQTKTILRFCEACRVQYGRHVSGSPYSEIL